MVYVPITFNQLMDFAGKHARMVTEGEAILKAKHLLSVGVKKTMDQEFMFWGHAYSQAQSEILPVKLRFVFRG